MKKVKRGWRIEPKIERMNNCAFEHIPIAFELIRVFKKNAMNS